MNIEGRLEVVKDADALAARAVELIAERMTGCDTPFRMVLSGGTTPVAAYRVLARKAGLAWDCVELFFSDERFVPPDHHNSNYRMVRETLLADGKVAPRKLFAIPTDDTPASAAARYDEMLRQQYGSSALEAGAPLFHLTLLGKVGLERHLLPCPGLIAQPAVDGFEQWAATQRIQKLKLVALDPAQLVVEVQQRFLQLVDFDVEFAQLDIDLVKPILHRAVNRV